MKDKSIKKKKNKDVKKKLLNMKLAAVAVIILTAVATFMILRAISGNTRTSQTAKNVRRVEAPNNAQGWSIIANTNQSESNRENITYEPFELPEDIFEVRERMFLAQVNDIYLNAADYLGKAIKLEGIFKSEKYYGLPGTYNYVARYGPGGCCGNDGMIGFEVLWPDNRPYPNPESWVEAIGVLKRNSQDGYIYLDLLSITPLNRRGMEYVIQ